MIYYGMRSHEHYLKRLWHIATFSPPHRLLTVAGGCSFLDAISPGCHSIAVIDNDAENLRHQVELIDLIKERLIDRDSFRSHVAALPARINLSGIDLTRDTYNWSFGQGFLGSEVSYMLTREILQRVPISFQLIDALTYDYSSAVNTEFLASNVDSPMFTPPGELIKRVAQTATSEVRYHSWILDAVIEPTGIRY